MDLINTITQRSMLARSPAGFEGMVSSDLGNRVKTMLPAVGLPQINTLTLTNWSSGRTYAATINGVEIEITTPSGDTNVTGAATRFAAAINADPRVRGQVKATSASGVVTLTSVLGGMPFTLAGSTDAAAASVQSATTPDPIPVGRGLLLDGQAQVVNEAYSERLGNLQIKRALAANLTARVVNVTPTPANSTAYGLIITLDDGTPYSFQVISDGTATAQEIVEAQVAAFPAALSGIVTATEDDAKLILTGAAGRSFEVAPYGAGVQAVAVGAAGDDLQRVFAGISVLDDTKEYTLLADGAVAIPSATPVGVLVEGEGMVYCTDAIVPGGRVYMELASGVDNGRFFAAPGSTRVEIERARWLRRATTSDNLAWLELARR